MPNVVGEELQTALKMLESAGFVNVVFDEYVESELPKDSVAEQSVAAGEEVPLNTVIVLKLSQGPAETTVPETEPAVTKMVTFRGLEGMTEAYHVKIVCVETGEVVFDGDVSSTDEEISIPLTGVGVLTYEVSFANGESYEIKVDFSAP